MSEDSSFRQTEIHDMYGSTSDVYLYVYRDRQTVL